jgi:DNA-binding NarL/FixJ family response regulator
MGLKVKDKKIISYVCFNRNLCDVKPLASKLESELSIITHPIKELNDLFPLLADPTFHTDYITIYIEDFFTINGVDSFEIIQTLDTLIKCTVYRPDNFSKPIKRNTKLVAVVSNDVPVETIKEILEFDAIAYLTPSGTFSYDEIKDSVRNFIEDGDRVPDPIKKLLKAKKISTKQNKGIQLTPRQKQIFELVSKRGASNKVIAKTLNISESTVKLHMGAILKKYNVRNRTQLAVFSKKSLTEV